MALPSTLTMTTPSLDIFETTLVDDLTAWDSFVLAAGGHVLQSGGWGELKSRFGWKAKRVLIRSKGAGVAGAQILFRPTPLGQFAYVPRGPVVDFDQPDILRALLAAVHQTAKQERAFMVKVEPHLQYPPPLAQLGFRTSAQTIQPVSSIVVDLQPDLEVLARLQKPKTRYNIGLATRRGVVVRQGTPSDLPAFYQALEVTGRRDDFGIHAPAYYQAVFETLGENARLFLAEYKDELLAGIVVTRFGPEAIYMYGASTNAHRNLMPNYLLQWEAMKWAKEQECTTYDLWGIPDQLGVPECEAEGATKDTDEPAPRSGGLWGVYRFKQGFGGTVVRFAGAFDYSYSPMRYLVWRRLLPIVRKQRLGG